MGAAARVARRSPVSTLPGRGKEAVVERFPIEGLEQVPGFLTPAAAWLLDSLGRHQGREGVGGDIVEIGVFYGRTAFVLGRTLSPDERLIACDTFTVGSSDVPGWTFPPTGPPEEELRRGWEELVGDPSSLHVIRGDSARLSPDDLGSSCRLVHVDGGHAYDWVLGDARTADASLGPDGVAVFDDVLLSEWPDVTVALVDHLRCAGDALVPFLVAEHKAFACRAPCAEGYRAWAERTAARVFEPRRHLVVTRSFLGERTVVVTRLPA